MTHPTNKHSLRNKPDYSLRRFSWFFVLSNTYFWTPVFILYFSTVVSLKQIFLLESIYYVSVFALEVPSGYFSDHVGRKKTLFLSCLFFCIAYALFFWGAKFPILALAQFFLAAGFAFASGTDTSLHFALLGALHKQAEYGKREGFLASWGLISSAGSAILGGLLAWLGEYRLAYALSFAFAFAAMLVLFGIFDPDAHNQGLQRAPLAQLRLIGGKLKMPGLRYLFSFSVIITVLNHIPYEFYQLYIRDFIHSLSLPSILPLQNSVPLATGIHLALTMLTAAFFARKTIIIEQKFGIKATFLIAFAIHISMMILLYISQSAIVVILLLLRSVPGPLTAPIVRKETAPKIPAGLRATYFSMQSLVGRLSFAFLLLLFHIAPGDGFSSSLRIGIAFGAAAFLLFFFLPGPTHKNAHKK